MTVESSPLDVTTRGHTQDGRPSPLSIPANTPSDRSQRIRHCNTHNTLSPAQQWNPPSTLSDLTQSIDPPAPATSSDNTATQTCQHDGSSSASIERDGSSSATIERDGSSSAPIAREGSSSADDASKDRDSSVGATDAHRNPDTAPLDGTGLPDDASPEQPNASVFIADSVRRAEVLPMQRTCHAARRQVTCPPHPATGDGTAFHQFPPVTAYVRISDSTDKRLALLDTGSSIGLIDAKLAESIGVAPTGPQVSVNGIGNDKTAGFVTLPFVISAAADREPVDIASSSDFHVVHNFGLGICLGLDALHAIEAAIDPSRGVTVTPHGTFPIYDQRGRPLVNQRLSKTIRTAAATTLPPKSHAWVRVTHGCRRDVDYVVDSSLWSHGPSRTLFATGRAVIDADTQYILVTNLSARPHRLHQNLVLGEAAPLVAGTQASRAGNFLLFAEGDEELRPPDSSQSTAAQDLSQEVPTAHAQGKDGEAPHAATRAPAQDKSGAVDHSEIGDAFGPNAAAKQQTADNGTAVRSPARPLSEQDLLLVRATAALASNIGGGTAPYWQATGTSSDAQPLQPSDEWPLPKTHADPRIALVDKRFRVGCPPDSDEPHQVIVDVLRRNLDAFSLDGRPGHIRCEPMRIPLKPGATLRPEAPRRVSPQSRGIIDANLEQLHDWDCIEPSNSSVSFPILLVKQGTKHRMCVDYRGLNEASTVDRYPLPRIDDVHEALGGCTIFSGLDAIRGYHQMDIAEEDRPKTTFVCHHGLYQYKQVPFGLRNAPAAFQRFMDLLLGGMRWVEALVYLDDVVVFSRTLAGHAASLERLLKAAIAVGLKFSPEKCTFATPELKLLGRKISADSVATLDDKTAAIQHLAAPTYLQDLYHALGLFNYYRSFIPRFAERVAPLTTLTKGHAYKKNEAGRWSLVDKAGARVSARSIKLDWGQDQQAAFEDLKGALVSPPVLAHPDFKKPFVLYVDSSKHAFAAALHQRQDAAAHDLETPPVPQATALPAETQSLHRILGDKDAYADAMALDPAFAALWRQAKAGDDTPGYRFLEGLLICTGPHGLDHQVCVPTPLLQPILASSHDAGHFGLAKSLLAIQDVAYHPRLVESLRSYIRHCPACLRSKPRRAVGRLDTKRMLTASKRPFHSISLDVAMGFPPDEKGRDALLVVTDLFSKMVLVEPCSKTATAADLYRAVEQMVTRRGWSPSVIITDSDARLVGNVAQRFARTIGAEIQPSRPYHQQGNPVERQIQTLQRVMRTLALDCDDWSTLAAAAELAINTSPSLATGYAPLDLVYVESGADRLFAQLSNDDDPALRLLDDRFALAHGRLRQARDAVARAQAVDKKRFDRHRRPLPTYRAGDRVLIRTADRPVLAAANNKLDPPTVGPFEVAEVLSPHRIRLSLAPDMKIDPIFDVSQLDPYPDSDPFGRRLDAEPVSAIDDEPTYKIDRIIDERPNRRTGERFFRVRWIGNPRPTWEPEHLLREDDCDQAILDWELRDPSRRHLPTSVPSRTCRS
ncbi:uncharacterized protein PFL1_03332 [Pseudozyma flocculosa PF-1]|uniref:Reverse transcriptase n=1 Tax=Pseudozyma flocculosa PF-1 TaxID=1277687 RepID=A0A061H861_9BASI|nr:uncharacterized protein PFL1_03332 [Pseudozyma flocculosa PF-1]EPQ29042.1 hypothetical protein PFL1_03332 [Pseudozyma flocculosa PF-1]